MMEIEKPKITCEETNNGCVDEEHHNENCTAFLRYQPKDSSPECLNYSPDPLYNPSDQAQDPSQNTKNNACFNQSTGFNVADN